MNIFQNSSKISEEGGFVQKSYPVYRYIYGVEGLFHLSFQDIWACCVQHVTKPVVHLWEKYGLINRGKILKSDEFHQPAFLGMHGLACDRPSDGCYLFAHQRMEVLSPHIIEAFQDIATKCEGVDRKNKTKDLGFMPQHDMLRVGGPVVPL